MLGVTVRSSFATGTRFRGRSATHKAASCAHRMGSTFNGQRKGGMKMSLVGGDAGNLRSRARCRDGSLCQRVATDAQESTLLTSYSISEIAVKCTEARAAWVDCHLHGRIPTRLLCNDSNFRRDTPHRNTIKYTVHAIGCKRIFVFDKDVFLLYQWRRPGSHSRTNTIVPMLGLNTSQHHTLSKLVGNPGPNCLRLMVFCEYCDATSRRCDRTSSQALTGSGHVLRLTVSRLLTVPLNMGLRCQVLIATQSWPNWSLTWNSQPVFAFTSSTVTPSAKSISVRSPF